MNRARMDCNGLSDRKIADMLCAAHELDHADVEEAEGWRRPLRTGQGFRYEYRKDIGKGGWDFHYLSEALSIAMVDFVAENPISRLHRLDDHIFFSAMLEGRNSIASFDSSEHAPVQGEELAHGFCMVGGLGRNEPVRTIYEPGRPMRWVTIFLRRDRLHELCGFDVSALPAIFREHIEESQPLGLRCVPLTGAASLAATQAFECSYTGELRRMYLIAKSIEIICAVIGAFRSEQPAAERFVLTAAEAEKVRVARAIIEENLEDPLGVPELAEVVGLSRQKLQLGFQLLYQASVGKLYKQVRLAKAVTLVHETNMPLIEVALECGYEHPGSFSRAFKLAFGRSPMQIRVTSSQKRSREALRMSTHDGG